MTSDKQTIHQPESSRSFACCSKTEVSSENTSTNGDSADLDFVQSNNNNEEISSFPKREPVNLAFRDIKYSVKSFKMNLKKIGFERKEILHNISGEFQAGKLTAIMGPSGAGKSTLLNLMAGYVCRGVDGIVEVNGRPRPNNCENFRKMSCYIHQDDAPRSWLTVKESMMIATHLKLGYGISLQEKNKLINKIVILLGLDQRMNTYTGKLSGGQKKRLAIALELINNPPVIFLDEPTTGLDSASCMQCITLLKKLANEGRTIVCTIHQPSALVFEQFDNLYAISKGHCIYQGRIKDLIPYLSDLGLNCPQYHNAADFLIDVAVGEYNADLGAMIAAAEKKYAETELEYGIDRRKSRITNYYRDGVELLHISAKPLQHENIDLMHENSVSNNNMVTPLPISNVDDVQTYHFMQSFGSEASVIKKTNKYDESITNYTSAREPTPPPSKKNYPQSASLLMQFCLLYKRNLISTRRNYFLLMARIAAHVFIATIFGYLYKDVGYQANTVLGNYVYLYGTILLLVYTGKMSVMMSFPLEMEMLTREHFNRWYKLGPYFLSIVLFEIPFQMFCASLYVIISYMLTGNYYENYRFVYFLLMCMAATLCAQGWGFLIGATLPIKMAVFIGPVLAVLFSVFGFCTRYYDITPVFRWMWHISYFRAGFHSVIDTVYGMNRPFLTCPETEIYCHFKNPKIFLKEMMIDDVEMSGNIALLAGVFLTVHILTVSVLWFKLNKR